MGNSSLGKAQKGSVFTARVKAAPDLQGGSNLCERLIHPYDHWTPQSLMKPSAAALTPGSDVVFPAFLYPGPYKIEN